MKLEAYGTKFIAEQYILFALWIAVFFFTMHRAPAFEVQYMKDCMRLLALDCFIAV